MILSEQERKRRLLLRLKGIETGTALIGPATVQFNLTDLCNLACQYCWYYGPGSTLLPTGKNHFSFEIFKKVVDDCAQLKVDTVHLSGVGDPSLHPHFYDILRYLEPSFEVHMNTNGTFPIERCRDILRASRIVINLGSPDRESYKILQGRDLFMKVIKNIRELAKLRPQFNPDFKIEVVIVMNRLNEGTHEKTELLVRKLGADHVYKKPGQVMEHTRHIIKPEDQEMKEEIKGDWPPCYHGWFFSAIKLGGDVNVCCFMQRLTMGNVNTTSFKEIWESDDYARARASALSGDSFRNYHECINCYAAWRNKEIANQMSTYNRIRKA